VGASTDDGVTALVAEATLADETSRQVEMRLMEGSVPLADPADALEYVPCGMALKPEDLPERVSGKIALIQRGEITFREKAMAAQRAGAIAAVIYNNHEGSFFGSLGDETEQPAIPVVAISRADGEFLLAASQDARLRLSPEEVPQADRLADFSSRGPNHDGWIKPDMTAPGVNIYSATIVQAPMPGGGMPDPSSYTNASGTSMATPHVAGAAALIRQAHPEWSSMQVKAALVNTARWMGGQGGVMDQGNGSLDLPRALDARAILVTADDAYSPSHSFGTVYNAGQVKAVSKALTIQALSTEPAQETYNLSVEIAGDPEGLTAELSATSGECTRTACFDLTLIADGAVLADGTYYGFVRAEAPSGTLRMPFYYEAAEQPAARPPEPIITQRGTPRRRIGNMPAS